MNRTLTLLALLAAFSSQAQAQSQPQTPAATPGPGTAPHAMSHDMHMDHDMNHAMDAGDNDTRKPLPMPAAMAAHQKQAMRAHLLAVSGVIDGLAAGDFAAIERAAAEMGYSDSMRQMCENFGMAGPGFTPQALAFHHTADGIITAARAHDRNGVVKALDATVKGCTACHATWKQQIVDQQTWIRLAEAAHLGR